MIRPQLLAAILVCGAASVSAASVLAADGPATAFIPPVPGSDAPAVDADTVSIPLPVAEEDDAAAEPAEPDQPAEPGTEAVPMPKPVRLRAFDYRTPLPTELPVIWPPPVAPIRPWGPAAPIHPWGGGCTGLSVGAR